MKPGPECSEEACKKYPDLKAVLMVHQYDLSADLDKIMEVFCRYNVPVIE